MNQKINLEKQNPYRQYQDHIFICIFVCLYFFLVDRLCIKWHHHHWKVTIFDGAMEEVRSFNFLTIFFFVPFSSVSFHFRSITMMTLRVINILHVSKGRCFLLDFYRNEKNGRRVPHPHRCHDLSFFLWNETYFLLKLKKPDTRDDDVRGHHHDQMIQMQCPIWIQRLFYLKRFSVNDSDFFENGDNVV